MSGGPNGTARRPGRPASAQLAVRRSQRGGPAAPRPGQSAAGDPADLAGRRDGLGPALEPASGRPRSAEPPGRSMRGPARFMGGMSTEKALDFKGSSRRLLRMLSPHRVLVDHGAGDGRR